MVNPETDTLLKQFMETAMPGIKAYLNPSQVVIFGSRIRGDADDDSDIDVIIVSDAFAGTPFIRRMAMVMKKIRFHRHVDFLCYTTAEFERIKHSSMIVSSALVEGFIAA